MPRSASRSAALIAEGPAEELDLTVNAQPAILATSVAYLEAMRAEARRGGRRAGAAAAGRPLGGAVRRGRRRRRDRLRDRHAASSASAAGSCRSAASTAAWAPSSASPTSRCTRSWTRPASTARSASPTRNAPGQIVLSGVIPALVFALEMSKTVGARKAVRLTVSVASHSPLMRRARDEFSQILAKVPFREPRVPMLGNVHASVIRPPTGCAGSSPSTSSTACSGPRRSAAWRPTA